MVREKVKISLWAGKNKGKRMKVSRSHKRAEEKSKKKSFWFGLWNFLEGICLGGVIVFCIYAFSIMLLIMVWLFEIPIVLVKIFGATTVLWVISRMIRKAFLNKR